MDDIFRRKGWSFSIGKVLDDCETDDVSDDKLNRNIGKIDDIRVEPPSFSSGRAPTSSRCSRNRGCARRLQDAVVEVLF